MNVLHFTVDDYETALIVPHLFWGMIDINANFETLSLYGKDNTKCFTFEIYEGNRVRLYAKDYHPRGVVRFSDRYDMLGWLLEKNVLTIDFHNIK